MRARAFLPMFLFAVALPALGGEEKKEDAIKVDLSYLEKTWGIKCKSHKITPPKPIFLDYPAGKTKDGKETKGRRVQFGTSSAEVKFLLEFTKDVENLKELRAAFTPVYETRGAVRSIRTWPLWFYVFDGENVFLYKCPLTATAVEGELTGKKEDAIRVSISIDRVVFNKTHKIAVRPGEKDKDKDKDKEKK